MPAQDAFKGDPKLALNALVEGIKRRMHPDLRPAVDETFLVWSDRVVFRYVSEFKQVWIYTFIKGNTYTIEVMSWDSKYRCVAKIPDGDLLFNYLKKAKQESDLSSEKKKQQLGSAYLAKFEACDLIQKLEEELE